MLGADIRVEENTIKIAENNPFIECLHDLHMISFLMNPLLIKLVPALIG